MKSNVSKAVCVYRNLEYEQLTRAQLESARKRLQSLLNEWSKLEIGDITDINELLMRPERVYKNAIDRLVAPPDSGGKFTINKAKYLENLDLPDPSSLYASAKNVRRQKFCASTGLWEVEGNEVVLNETEAGEVINSQSLFTNDPDKTRLVKDVHKLCELYNSLNKKFNGELLQGTPWTFNHFRGKFIVSQKSYGGQYQLEIDPDFLRKIL